MSGKWPGVAKLMVSQEQDLSEHDKYSSSCARDEMLGWTSWCGVQLESIGTEIRVSSMSLVLNYFFVPPL